LDLESWNNGATSGVGWNFRYKTNEPNANTWLYNAASPTNSGTVASISSSNILGTYTVTFTDNTNVTMLMPGNVSTNFSIPDTTGATIALFADGVDLYFGAQAGNTGGTSDHIVASEFSVTGLGAADFDDNFVADAGTLNSSIWTVNAAFTNCVRLLGPGNPYWVDWTTPALGFTLESTAALASPASNILWAPVTTYAPIQNGSFYTQLISTNDLQPGITTFFGLAERTFTQLLVLLPGQTNAPDTATGIKGTPTPVDLQTGTQGSAPVTVLAVDSRFYPVGGITDSINLTSATDGSGTVLGADPAPMVNGVVTFNWYFGTPGGQTVTATDNTDTSIQPVTTVPVQVLNQ
jgi:hypothetical protein